MVMIHRFIMELNIPQFIWFALLVGALAGSMSAYIKDEIDRRQKQREMIEKDKLREKAKKLREGYLHSFSLSGPFKPDKYIIGVDWADGPDWDDYKERPSHWRH